MSQTESSEKSSLRMTEPRPRSISGAGVLVGKAFSVGVADGGNQIMVAVGSGVSDGRSVSVGGIDVDGTQAPIIIVIARRKIFPTKQSPNRVGDCRVRLGFDTDFVLLNRRLPRNDG